MTAAGRRRSASLGCRGPSWWPLRYNTPVHNPPAPEHESRPFGLFHNQIVMQSAAYQNGLWIVAVAKCGDEEGVPMIAGTQIIAPSGHRRHDRHRGRRVDHRDLRPGHGEIL